MAEIDLLLVLVIFEHREIDDPAELELALLDEAKLLADAGAGEASQLRGIGRLAGGKEAAVVGPEAERVEQRSGGRLAMVLGDGAAEFSALARHIAEAGIALGARPLVHVVEELAAQPRRVRRRDGAHRLAGLDQLGKQAEAGAAEMLADILNDDRVAQIGLVVAVFQHRFRIGNARKGALGHRPGLTPAKAGELLEHAGEHRLDGGKHIVLRDEAHLEIELVEFAGAAVGAGVFIAEAGRDLEVAVKARHHQQLLEHLRRLGKRIEFAGMHAAGHQIVARAFRAAGGEDRRLEFGEALLDHAAAQARDHLAAQHDIGVQPIAAQIEEAIFQADVFGIISLAGNRHRQLIGGGLDSDVLRAHLDLAGGQPGIDRTRLAQHHLAGDGDDRFHPDAIKHRKGRRRRAGNDLGDAMVVAQIDEQHAAMVALAVNPARQLDGLAGIGAAQLGAIVGAIGVHG